MEGIHHYSMLSNMVFRIFQAIETISFLIFRIFESIGKFSFIGNSAIVDILMKNGANFKNHTNKYGETALHLAAKNGKFGIL